MNAINTEYLNCTQPTNKDIAMPDTNQVITGASGAQYVPMDTSPQAQPTPHQIVAQISTLLTQLVSVITSQQQATQPTHNTEDFKCLSDEVSEVLDEVLESKVGECLDNILEEKLVEILSRRTITINF